jgi:hypothetical protein
MNLASLPSLTTATSSILPNAQNSSIIIRKNSRMGQRPSNPPTDHLVKINGTFWNAPEGCVSIMNDYSNGGSLSTLVQNIGSIPEPVLRDLAK